MKKAILTILVCLLTLGGWAQFPKIYAHRGCWSMTPSNEFIIPENSIPAVAMAKRMGYEGIECDVHYTKDKVMVILHDATLNRTLRNAKDYSPIEKNIRLADLTFEELRNNYVLASTNPEYRTPIPTLEELLTECKKQGIVPMLHSDLEESYRMAQSMFGNQWICFTGLESEIQKVRKYSECLVLLAINEGTPEANIERLKRIGGHCGVSTMNYNLLTKEFCQALTREGYEVQASIFPAPKEATGQLNGVSFQLTDFSFMPTKGMKPKHTLNLMKKAKLPTEKIECGAFVLELKVNGEVEIIIDQKQTYPISSDGKKSIYIGRRFFNQSIPDIQVKGDKAKVKKMKLNMWEL